MSKITVKTKQNEKYNISRDLFGIFLEDINFACDGGLNANQVNNYSFDGAYRSWDNRGETYDYLRYWKVECGQMKSGTKDPMSENSRYAVILTGEKAVITNNGYNALKAFKDKAAISVRGAGEHVFSAYMRNAGFEGKVYVSVVGDDNAPLSEKIEFEVNNTSWEKKEFTVKGLNSGYGKLVIEFCGKGEIHIDCVVFRSADVWGKDDPKWRHTKLRRDLVEALEALKPKFLRFPGGCIVEGEFVGNEYNWKDTVGELWERKQKYNLWSERTPNNGYSQSYQVGFYEYFCLCEDLGMKPLPTLWAGLNCQCRSDSRKEPYTGFEVDDPKFKTEVIDMYLDLIEFANGDPEKNEWAALRAKMGHPEPFGLDRIGVGNENYHETYFEKYTAIKNAIDEKYPGIKCILSAGLSPDAERIAPTWDFAKSSHPDSIVDEHSYNTPQWFIDEETRYDNYERGKTKVYMGEYAANCIPSPRRRTDENGNCYDSAIAEAAFLCGIERNGDVVEMSSYAPLFNLVSSDQWCHNLIDFNPAEVCLTSNYFVQKIFSSKCGDVYIPTQCEKDDNIFVSCVQSGKTKYLRVVNITDEEYELEADAEDNISAASCETICSPEGIYVKNRLGFYGKTDYKIKCETTDVEFSGSTIKACIEPMSINVFTLN